MEAAQAELCFDLAAFGLGSLAVTVDAWAAAAHAVGGVAVEGDAFRKAGRLKRQGMSFLGLIDAT
ncbi:hypothetical protein [Streptomyces sp. NPDC047042]|uniref:hypothetical protein n=1 Tax=Streptomyces sp. NPDC047042 TaxID=3154807 RepID=UPI00340C3167